MKDFSLKTLRQWLPPRPDDGHKGNFGHALIVAGSRGMSGAAVLAARGALRSGCGLVTLAVPKSQQPIVAAQNPEALTAALPETSSGTLRAEASGVLQKLQQSRGFSVLALGPGLTTHPETIRAVAGILGSLSIPTVLDADALNILALQPKYAVKGLLKSHAVPRVFTPHPGELARLLRTKTSAVLEDRRSHAARLCAKLGGVCLLKGRGTIITDGSRFWVNPTGNAGLAKGGSGDVLTGIIAGLWAQRLRASKGEDLGFEAAALGAYVHGLAADIAVREKTAYALAASDVLETLPAAFRKLI